MDAPLLAARWWKEYRLLSRLDTKVAALETFASRSFASQDFVFALDAYTQAFALRKAQVHATAQSSKNEKSGLCVITAEFAYKYLHSALQVQDPQANVKWDRQLLAWELVRCVTYVADPDQYGDESFYKLRAVCFSSFRSIYDAVFAWEDPPAIAIAQWWRTSCERRRAALAQHAGKSESNNIGNNETLSSRQPSTERTAERSGSQSSKTKPRGAQRALHAPSRSPSATTAKPRSTRREKARASKHELPVQRGNATAISTGASSAAPTNQADDDHSGSRCITQGSVHAQAVTRRLGRQLGAGKCGDTWYENSPTKRRLSAVRYGREHPHAYDLPTPLTHHNSRTHITFRHLRKQRLVDELPDRNVVLATVEESHVDESDQQASSPSTGQTLLDLYSFPPSTKAAFVASTGRDPGFADLDIAELEQYARVAHYRALVLAHRHLDTSKLDVEHVKPQWLLAIERIEKMLSAPHDQQRQTEKETLGGDESRTVATRSHLTQIHSRVVFQLTALLQQYTRDFGDTRFTRQLRSLLQRLSRWQLDQIPAICTALDAAKSAAVAEEKQRNLEFYHVYESVQQQQQHRPPADNAR